MRYPNSKILRIGIILVLLPLLAGFLLSPRTAAGAPSFSDDFNTNMINPAVWSEQFFGRGPSVLAANQTAIVTIAANSTADPATGLILGGLSSVCLLRGDFDMQVDYNLLVWPQSSGVRVGLRFTQGPGHAVERVGRAANEGPPPEVYLTHFQDGIQGIVGTSDFRGTLRMVRSGELLSGYYLSPTGWVLIHTGPTQDNAGDVHFGFSVWTGYPGFAQQTVRVGFDNFVVNNGQVICPAFTVSPTSGPVGTSVHVKATGFPTSSYGPDQVVMSFDGNFLGIATNINGDFNFTFNVPQAQPGSHLVNALDQSSGGSANANFTVILVNTITISLDVGTLYFPSDTASVYTLLTLSGSPLNSTSVQLQLALTRPDGSVVTLNNTFIGAGLFKAVYAIPKTGPIGTYAIVAKAHVANVQDTSALTTFEVKPTWLNAQGPALTATGATLTGVVTVAAVMWRRGIFRSRND